MLDSGCADILHRCGIISTTEHKLNKYRNAKLDYAVKHWLDDTNHRLDNMVMPTGSDFVAVRDREFDARLANDFAFLVG